MKYTSEETGKSADTLGELNYRAKGRCDGCSKTRELTYMHADRRSDPGSACVVLALCDKCARWTKP